MIRTQPLSVLKIFLLWGHSMTTWTKFCPFLTTTYLLWTNIVLSGTTYLLSTWTIQKLSLPLLRNSQYNIAIFWSIGVIEIFIISLEALGGQKIEIWNRFDMKEILLELKRLHGSNIQKSLHKTCFKFNFSPIYFWFLSTWTFDWLPPT